MKDSLKNLLDMFPYFFKKDEDSNFYKSQKVTNNRLREVYQSLFDTAESFRLSKRCLVWKEQSEAYEYQINFVANFPFLKNVTIYKNDTEIYSESFDYADEVNSFEYAYTHSTLNDVNPNETADIIPQDKFKIIVETHEEFTIKKGFPENNEPQGNEFDHDESLDEIGALHNIPRKEYLIVGEELYPATEPPYNDRATEDDYHYMKRMLNYLKLVQEVPLPVAEIYKLYGVTSTMENREKLLLKVFDMEKHPNFIDDRKNSKGEYIAQGDRWFSGTLNKETGEITEWAPKKWEHLDKFCDYNDILGKYFFVQASTTMPVKHQNIIFTFLFLNSLAQELSGDFLVDITLNNQIIVQNCSEKYFEVSSAYINVDEINSFIITGKTSDGEIIGTEKVDVKVRGCDSADYYVSINGSDDNKGDTRATAFRTIQKAVNKCNGNRNLIAILEGTHEITVPVNINKNCVIIGCGEAIIRNDVNSTFFKVYPGISVLLQDFTVAFWSKSVEVTDMLVSNYNSDNSLVDVLLDEDSALIPIENVLDGYDNIITNMTYSNGVWSYTAKPVSQITKLSDLNNAAMNITYEDGIVSYDIFTSDSDHSDLTPQEVSSLNGILVSLSYENGIVKYEELIVE